MYDYEYQDPDEIANMIHLQMGSFLHNAKVDMSQPEEGKQRNSESLHLPQLNKEKSSEKVKHMAALYGKDDERWEKDADNGLSYSKMKHVVDYRHPRKEKN